MTIKTINPRNIELKEKNQFLLKKIGHMKEQLDEFVKRKDIEILDLKDKVKIRKEISE